MAWSVLPDDVSAADPHQSGYIMLGVGHEWRHLHHAGVVDGLHGLPVCQAE